jgi:hypothetical protein
MAKNSRNRLKNILLFGFVAISVLLVAFQWVDALLGDGGDANPAFVRPTLENFEVDPEAYENWNQMEPTPSQEANELSVTPTP